MGLDQGFTQEVDAPEYYLPDFEKKGHPFEPTTTTLFYSILKRLKEINDPSSHRGLTM